MIAKRVISKVRAKSAGTDTAMPQGPSGASSKNDIRADSSQSRRQAVDVEQWSDRLNEVAQETTSRGATNP